jgi:hypothetical protein
VSHVTIYQTDMVPMAQIDHRARPAGPPDDDASRPTTWRHRIARLRKAIQDRLWRADEEFATDRGWTAQRSPSGWSIRVRDPRFDRRKECGACGGTGRDRITGADCPDCDATGVVTLPPGGGEQR